MASPTKPLGVLKPLGGGDPVPLLKAEILVGRRPSCDVCLDFENVSGKHCQLRLIHGVWHVRDLHSTNGTTINGAPLTSDHGLMPDDELGIATHLFHLDYEPSGPEAALKTKDHIDEDMLEVRKRTSLLELAGLDTDDDKPRRARRPTKAPEVIERLSADEADFEDELPEHIKDAPAPKIAATDDDFFNLIAEDVEDPKK